MSAHPLREPLYGAQAAELGAWLRRLATGRRPETAPVDPVPAAYAAYLQHAYTCPSCWLLSRCAEGPALWETYLNA
jgi:hypothetical protein